MKKVHKKRRQIIRFLRKFVAFNPSQLDYFELAFLLTVSN